MTLFDSGFGRKRSFTKKDKEMESNKLIAEFMGIDLISSNVLRKAMLNDLTYHSDWNELMQVVEKIERLDGKKYLIINQGLTCLVWDRDEGEEIFNESFKGETKIEAVYQAVIEFIKWYNEQNK